MKQKVMLKKDLRELRSERGISLLSLAEAVYSTDTTLFRAERAGFLSDENLAKALADFFGIPFDEFCEVIDGTGGGEAWWNQQVLRVRQNRCLADKEYYVCFLTVYEAHRCYSAALPSYWKSSTGNKEVRVLQLYSACPELEGLRNEGIPFAVANEDVDVDFFFHSLDEGQEGILLIKKDVAADCLLRLNTEYEVTADKLFDKFGFKDCVWV